MQQTNANASNDVNLFPIAEFSRVHNNNDNNNSNRKK